MLLYQSYLVLLVSHSLLIGLSSFPAMRSVPSSASVDGGQ